MTKEELKKIEANGYARGYAAGRRRQKADDQRRNEHQERQAFLDRAFLAALPACIVAQDWKFGEKPIRSQEDRVRLAWTFAAESLKQRKR